jgi:hypothetical protein
MRACNFEVLLRLVLTRGRKTTQFLLAEAPSKAVANRLWNSLGKLSFAKNFPNPCFFVHSLKMALRLPIFDNKKTIFKTV